MTFEEQSMSALRQLDTHTHTHELRQLDIHNRNTHEQRARGSVQCDTGVVGWPRRHEGDDRYRNRSLMWRRVFRRSSSTLHMTHHFTLAHDKQPSHMYVIRVMDGWMGYCAALMRVKREQQVYRLCRDCT